MKRRDLEALECIKLTRWRDANKLLWPQLTLLLHIPNEGGSLTGRELIKRRNMGVVPGAPDFVLLASKLASGGILAIEMKTERGHLSKDQRKFKANFEAFGGRYVVCRSAGEAVREIKRELNVG